MIALSSCYEDSCSHDFSHCAHHSSFDEKIFTLVPLIFFKGVVRNVSNCICIYHAHVRYYKGICTSCICAVSKWRR